jgi:hypothetical protein
MDHHVGPHAPVVRAAELCADDRVGAGPSGRKGQHGWLAWNDVLLEPELGYPEGVDDIASFHMQFHRLAYRNMQFSAGDVGVGLMKDEGKLHGCHVNGQGSCLVALAGIGTHTNARPDFGWNGCLRALASCL